MTRVLCTLAAGLIAVAACSCATAPMFGPEGDELFVIECGTNPPHPDCHQRAQEICPAGYNKISQLPQDRSNRRTVACK